MVIRLWIRSLKVFIKCVSCVSVFVFVFVFSFCRFCLLIILIKSPKGNLCLGELKRVIEGWCSLSQTLRVVFFHSSDNGLQPGVCPVTGQTPALGLSPFPP